MWGGLNEYPVARADLATAAWLLRGVAGNGPAASAAPLSHTVGLLRNDDERFDQ